MWFEIISTKENRWLHALTDVVQEIIFTYLSSSFLFFSCPSIYWFDEEGEVFEEEGDLAFNFFFA